MGVIVKIIRPGFLLLAIAVTIAATNTDPARVPGNERGEAHADIIAELEDHLNSIVDPGLDDPIHNAILLVNSPTISWKSGAGMADGVDEPMTADHKFKIASITKTMTATVVLQLVEEGRLDLDGTLEGLIDPSVVDLDTLHICEGISYGRRITIRQLLSHTSGIRDYMEDPRFVPFVAEHADSQWSPEMIFGCYYGWEVNTKAAFPPGEDYIYSDVNYVLLAMIIEKVTDSTLAEQYRKRIFDPLGMADTYLEFYEKPTGSKPLSHAFLGDMDISASINTSFDWGGGGVVSTCEDLDLFFRALLGGRLFAKASTLQHMLAAADLGHGGGEFDYGLGIMKRTIEGLTFYGHGGAYDCDVFFSPDAGISVCTVLNQMETHGKRDPFLENAVAIVMKVPPGQGRRPPQ